VVTCGKKGVHQDEKSRIVRERDGEMERDVRARSMVRSALDSEFGFSLLARKEQSRD
jgi:hypothetical protein